MDVYRQAVDIIKMLRAGKGTAKALCLCKQVQKKKQTYAVVCETLRHYELLEDVLAVSEFFKYYPNANRELALCMVYDTVLGKGVNTKTDSTARAIQSSASYLREAYWQVHKHHIIPPRAGTILDQEMAGNDMIGRNGRKAPRPEGASNGPHHASTASSDGVARVPRYARINTLKIAAPTLIERLQYSIDSSMNEGGISGVKRPRGEATEEGGKGNEVSEAALQSKRRRGAHRRLILPAFTSDAVVPSLLVFPPGTDLHAHPAVRSGQLILQDRASCLPACVLLDAVPVVKSFPTSLETPVEGEKTGGKEPKAANASATLEYVVDACAAPGNKTSHLAALGAPGIKIMAVERDERRAELLQRRMQTLGAADYVNVVNMDFFQLSSDDREATEGILLDPSCSASGVTTRVDVALMHHRRQHPSGEPDEVEPHEPEGEEGPYANSGTIDPEAQGNTFSADIERVRKLASLQRKLLAHSLLSFQNCRTVVYSTCSVHEEENEAVVRQVLEDSRVHERGWRLSNIMPGLWRTRGITKADDTFPLDYTIRCDPAVDATNGFFVARFDREL
ncbi:unnamed protein product [Phytomonas sp. EM1]|nr:unnamed protein product [Phytomonas sp. EM1]|eukprot:CCW62319.1 unnamed protein product [Phytomonas sp. isolate EM1]